MFCVIPSMRHTSLVNFDANRGSRSLMILLGSPKHLNTWVTKTATVSSDVMASLHGINSAALVQSWSVTVKMESYPWEGGNFVMKSTAMTSNGVASGFGKIGCNGALVGLVFTLHRWHSAQPFTYCRASCRNPGHQ